MAKKNSTAKTGKDRKAIRAKQVKKPIKVHTYFSKDGDAVKRVKKSCPKCGQGFFMAAHKSRSSCGKCRYTEFGKKE